MSNRINRYKTIYDKMVRPNNASPFPKHVFVRAANLHSNVYDRVGDRQNCFDATLIHLTERFTGKEVYLIGTMNQSTMLAKRTQKLIEQIKPDAVYVQANNEWYEQSKLLKFVDSQEEFNIYLDHFDRFQRKKWLEYYWNTRKFLFLTRFSLYYMYFQWHLRLGYDFKFWRPGLEIKYACESAEKVGAKLVFLGPELDAETWDRLQHEHRMNVPHYLWKRFTYMQTTWSEEMESNRLKVHQAGPKAFIEKCLDQHLINWYIQVLEIFFPKWKNIFVDRKDEDFFLKLDKAKQKKIVAVVNQWHIEGIEHYWCHRYGQLPRSVVFKEPINPIGDFDLRDGLFQRLYNALHRQIASANTRATPSTYADWIIGYHRESNWQYEHRDM